MKIDAKEEELILAICGIAKDNLKEYARDLCRKLVKSRSDRIRIAIIKHFKNNP
jgi:hypothetical protein